MQLPTPPRGLFALALLGLLGVALAGCDAGEAELGGARLLASAYEDSRSRLVLIDPAKLDGGWLELAAIEHAEGWDVEGVVAPSGGAAAVLALPPGRSRTHEEAVLWLVTAEGKRALAEGLDLFAGLAFSDDGERIAVARNGGAGGRIDILNTADGAPAAIYRSDGALALYPVALRGERLWVAARESAGWALWKLALADGAVVRERRWALGGGAMRNWTLSPDGGALAVEVRDGTDFWVAVHSLTDAEAAPQVAASQSWISRRLRPLKGQTRRILNAAAPAWRPDGQLTVGRWSEARGFTLPLAWDPAGRWLAVAAYDGVGPGDPGRASVGVVQAERGLERIAAADIYAIGWWTTDVWAEG